MTEIFPIRVELMQRTVDLTWNKPEWMLPKSQSDIDTVTLLVDVLIAYNGAVISGKFATDMQRFYNDDAEPIDTKDVDFWAYMPKHPTK